MKSKIIVPATIFLGAVLFQFGLQFVMRPYAIDNFYFQFWTSEALMHTVSIVDLRDAPLETIWNIHINPPLLDTIRAIFVYMWPAPYIGELLLHVDHLLYVFLALLYGCLATVSFLWLSKLTNTKYAIIATVLLLLHPASIFYATFFDTTFLTALLVLLLYYLLWKVKQGQVVSIAAFIFVVLALFFTRTIFQLPFLVVMVASLFMIGATKRNILTIFLVAGVVMGLYSVKQYYKFGIFTTSSFAGFNLNRSVGNYKVPDYYKYLTNLDKGDEKGIQDTNLPLTLVRTEKSNGTINLNNIHYIKLNQELLGLYKSYLIEAPVLKIIFSYLENLYIYFKPSSTFTEHVIVDRLPWRGVYDRVFSFPILFVLLISSGVMWFYKEVKYKDIFPTIGFLLPAFYIFLNCVLFEKGENNRFKFFLEPVFFIFLAVTLYVVARQVYMYSQISSKNNLIK